MLVGTGAYDQNEPRVGWMTLNLICPEGAWFPLRFLPSASVKMMIGAASDRKMGILQFARPSLAATADMSPDLHAAIDFVAECVGALAEGDDARGSEAVLVGDLLDHVVLEHLPFASGEELALDDCAALDVLDL